MIDHLLTYQFYSNPFLAKKDRETLKKKGISSYIMNEHAILTDWMISQTIGGVYLKVFDEGLSDVKLILKVENTEEKAMLEQDDILWEYCELANQYTMSRYKNGSKLLRFLCFGILTVLAFSALSCDPAFEAPKSKERIERLVLVRFKKDLPEKKLKELLQKIKMLSTLSKDGRPYLKVEYGFQNSKEGLSAGYNIGIRISFRSYEDRDYFDGKSSEPGMSISAYGNFKESLKPYLDLSNKLFSFDFASNEKGNGNVPGKGYRLDHWVLFKFRNTITEAEKQKVINRFLELKNSLKNGNPYIQFIEYGYKNSKTKSDTNFEIAFRVSFLSLEDRDYYVGKPFQNGSGNFDPMHDEFKNFVSSYLESTGGALVFDYDVIK